MKPLRFGREFGGGGMVPVANNSDHRNWRPTHTGAAFAIPAGARFVEIKTFTAEAWALVGKAANMTVAAAPTTAVTDGTAPQYIDAGGSWFVALEEGETHLSILCTGPILTSYWS